MTAMNRRSVLKGFGTATALGAMGAFLPRAAFANEAVAIQLSWVPNVAFAGQAIALQDGLYSAEGMDVELRSGGPEVDPTALVVAKQVLIGLNGLIWVAGAVSNGAPVKIVGATFQRDPTCIASLADKPILTPQDMVGRKIGVQSDSMPLVEAVLKLNGIDPAGVTIVPVGYDPAPLVAGEVDGFLAFLTNQPVALAAQGIATSTMLLADFGLLQFTDVLMVHQDTLADPAQRALLVKTLRATVKGWQVATDKPQAAADASMAMWGAEMMLDANAELGSATAQAPLILTDETRANGLLTMSEAAIAANIATMAAVGVSVNRDLFDTDLMKEVLNGAARL